MINDILHAELCCQAAAVAAVVIVVVLQAFLRAIHFHSDHKTSSQSKKNNIYMLPGWPGGKNIDTETETENQKPKKRKRKSNPKIYCKNINSAYICVNNVIWLMYLN